MVTKDRLYLNPQSGVKGLQRLLTRDFLKSTFSVRTSSTTLFEGRVGESLKMGRICPDFSLRFHGFSRKRSCVFLLYRKLFSSCKILQNHIKSAMFCHFDSDRLVTIFSIFDLIWLHNFTKWPLTKYKGQVQYPDLSPHIEYL